jgi:glycosyltransferase involved in cell wall biosynthesis
MSNLYIDKGPLDLVEASRRLHALGVAHRVILVGGKVDAAVDEALARAIAEDGNGRIDLRDAIYGAQKDALLHSVQIFAFPSYYHFECQPLSVIEAMSHGLAIVASNIAGIPDLIRDGEDGFLIPSCDPDAMVSALRQLLLDRRLCERLGRSARERYETLFTLQAFERRLVETIEKIVL